MYPEAEELSARPLCGEEGSGRIIHTLLFIIHNREAPVKFFFVKKAVYARRRGKRDRRGANVTRGGMSGEAGKMLTKSSQFKGRTLLTIPGKCGNL